MKLKGHEDRLRAVLFPAFGGTIWFGIRHAYRQKGQEVITELRARGTPEDAIQVVLSFLNGTPR